MDISKIISRVTGVLLKPQQEWPSIASEVATTKSVWTSYVAILTTFGPIMGLLVSIAAGAFFGALMGGASAAGIGFAILTAILTYALLNLVVFLTGLIIDALAPSFGAEKNSVQAYKTAAYGFTPIFILGLVQIINVVPFLGWGLYILLAIGALVWATISIIAGLPHTMKAPADKAVGYGVVSIICAIVMYFILNLVLLAPIAWLGARSAMNNAISSIGEQAGVDIDADSALGKMAEAAKGIEAASKKMEEANKSGDNQAAEEAIGQMMGAVLGGGNKVESLSSDQLKGFLPENLNGLPRTSFKTEKNGAFGMNISTARADFSDGTRNFDLEITDLGTAKGALALAGFVNIEREEQSDQGYEKTYRQAGRWMTEKFNNNDQSGEFSTIVGERFAVKVTGRGTTMEELKATVAAINLAGLEALKDQGVSKQ